jgi:hypothetical protein
MKSLTECSWVCDPSGFTIVKFPEKIALALYGHGYESHSGAHGHRGYNEKMTFVWVGAAVDIPRKVHKHLTTLGPKLY